MNKPSLKKLVAAGTLMLSATALSLPAFSHQADNPCNGGRSNPMGMGQIPMMGGGSMGMMGGMGGGHMGMMRNMMGGDHMGMMSRYKGIGLTDEQKQQMSDIQHGLRKKHWEIMGQMIDQQAALQKAHAGDRPDPKAVGAVYSEIFDLKRQMIEASLEAKNSAKNVLTEEQRAKEKTPAGYDAGSGDHDAGWGEPDQLKPGYCSRPGEDGVLSGTSQWMTPVQNGAGYLG